MEGDRGNMVFDAYEIISIHTLRVEGDIYKLAKALKVTVISIHTLRVEGDSFQVSLSYHRLIFQSTPSVWRVTNLGNRYPSSE